MVVHTFNTNTPKQRQRISEFKVSQGYTEQPCLEKNKTEIKTKMRGGEDPRMPYS